MSASSQDLRERIREHLEEMQRDHAALDVDPATLSTLPPGELLRRLADAGGTVRVAAESERQETAERADRLRARGRLALGLFALCVAVALSGSLVPALDPFGMPAIGLAAVSYLVFRFGYVARVKARRRVTELEGDVTFWDKTLSDWASLPTRLSSEKEPAALQRLERTLGDARTRARRLRA